MARLLYFNCGSCACIEVAGKPQMTFLLIRELAQMEIRRLKIVGDINYIEARNLTQEIATNPAFSETAEAFAEGYLSTRGIPVTELDGIEVMYVAHLHKPLIPAPVAQT